MMTKLNVSITPELAGFVEDEVKSGAYVSASEVVREGLRLLARERAAETDKLMVLKREIGIGLADLAAGRVVSRSAGEIADAVLAGHEREP